MSVNLHISLSARSPRSETPRLRLLLRKRLLKRLKVNTSATKIVEYGDILLTCETDRYICGIQA